MYIYLLFLLLTFNGWLLSGFREFSTPPYSQLTWPHSTVICNPAIFLPYSSLFYNGSWESSSFIEHVGSKNVWTIPPCNTSKCFMDGTFDLWSSSAFITWLVWILIFGSTASLCIICSPLCRLAFYFYALRWPRLMHTVIKWSANAKMTSIVSQCVCHIKYALFMLIKSFMTIGCLFSLLSTSRETVLILL